MCDFFAASLGAGEFADLEFEDLRDLAIQQASATRRTSMRARCIQIHNCIRVRQWMHNPPYQSRHAVNSSLPPPVSGDTLPLALMTALALSACHSSPVPVAPPAPVLAMTVHPQTGADSLHFPVEVAPRYSNSMSFRVSGKLIERLVHLGDKVRQGQVVARLDPLDATQQLASATAAQSAAEHRLAFARQQLDRDQAQAAHQLIAAAQLEQTQDNYAAAVASRDQATAQWRLARNTLRYNQLVADHAGFITSENADTGATVAAGQAIYGLAWNGDTDIILDAAQSDLPRIRTAQEADVTFTALPGAHFAARVREIAPMADAESRSYRVKLTLTQAGNDLRLGMTGDAILKTTAHGGQPPPPASPCPLPPCFIRATSRRYG